MKTSHQFANELLAGPDLPIVIQITDETDDLDRYRAAAASETKAEDPDGKSQNIIVIGGITKASDVCPKCFYPEPYHPYGFAPSLRECPKCATQWDIKP